MQKRMLENEEKTAQWSALVVGTVPIQGSLDWFELDLMYSPSFLIQSAPHFLVRLHRNFNYANEASLFAFSCTYFENW